MFELLKTHLVDEDDKNTICGLPVAEYSKKYSALDVLWLILMPFYVIAGKRRGWRCKTCFKEAEDE